MCVAVAVFLLQTVLVSLFQLPSREKVHRWLQSDGAHLRTPTTSTVAVGKEEKKEEDAEKKGSAAK